MFLKLTFNFTDKQVKKNRTNYKKQQYGIDRMYTVCSLEWGKMDIAAIKEDCGHAVPCNLLQLEERANWCPSYQAVRIVTWGKVEKKTLHKCILQFVGYYRVFHKDGNKVK